MYQVFLAPSQRELAAGRATNASEVGSFSAFSVSAVEQHEEHGHGGVPQLMLTMNAAARKLLAGSLRRDPAFVFVRRGLVSQGSEIQDKMDETFFTIEEVRVEARNRVRRAGTSWSYLSWIRMEPKTPRGRQKPWSVRRVWAAAGASLLVRAMTPIWS